MNIEKAFKCCEWNGLGQKICVVLVEPEGLERAQAVECKRNLFDLLRKRKVIESDTEIGIKSLEKGCELGLYASYSYFALLTIPQVLEAMIQAEREGYDAVTVACSFDPGIEEAREILQIPVVGILEASFAMAQMLGGRPRSVVIITVSDKAALVTNDLVDKYGFRPYMIHKEPVRVIPFDAYIKATTSPSQESIKNLKDAYIDVAKRSIEEGAEIIITGCGGLGPLLAVEGIWEVDGVPVLDPMTAGVKMAEALIDLKRIGIRVSRRVRYLPPAKEDLKKGRKCFGLG